MFEQDEEGTAGTLPQDDRDAGESQTAGTPDADDRDAGTRDDSQAALLETWKQKAQRVNDLEAENAALRAQQRQSPAASGGTAAEDESYWAGVQEWASKGDPVAIGLVRQRARDEETRAMNEQTLRAVRDNNQIQGIADPELRREVIEHYGKNLHRLGDPEAARAEVENRRYVTENQRLSQQLKRYQDGKRDPDVVRTLDRAVPSSEAKQRRMTGAQFDSQIQRLESENRFTEAIALRGRLAKGEIDVTD